MVIQCYIIKDMQTDFKNIRDESLYMPQLSVSGQNPGIAALWVCEQDEAEMETKNENIMYIVLTPRKARKFHIERDSFVQFSKKVQQKKDFLGIASKLLASAYFFCRKSKPQQPRRVTISSKTRQIQQLIDLVKSNIRAKELANGRGDIQGSSEYFIQLSQRLSQQFGLRLTLIKGEELLKNGFRLHHAVGRGSAVDPVFINIAYNGNKDSSEWLALVAKGVLFDTGGLNLKSSEGIGFMFLDKHGACSCFSAFQGIIRQKLKINVTVSMGFAQNFIGANSYRPEDIIKSRKGLTVRIADTDSEGRLILADAMNWTQQTYKISHMVEMSTLTYSCIKALGKFHAGVYGNDEDFSKMLLEVGKQVGEEGWILPVTEDHHEMLECPEADCISDLVDDCPGGSLAAAFLQKFVEKGVKWIHLDSVGVCIDMSQKSGTGWGAKILMNLGKHLSARQ